MPKIRLVLLLSESNALYFNGHTRSNGSQSSEIFKTCANFHRNPDRNYILTGVWLLSDNGIKEW